MLAASAAVLLFSVQTSFPVVGDGADIGRVSDLNLFLSSDRDQYYVGEPLRLRLTARNDGSVRVVGYVQIWGEECDIEYRRDELPFARLFRRSFAYDRAGPEGVRDLPGAFDVERVASAIQPQAEATSSTVLATLPTTGALLLSQPGTYEFRAVCAPRYESGDMLRSNVLSVAVGQPSRSDIDALRSYVNDGLAAFLQAPVGNSRQEPAVMRRAASFMDRHPIGVYSDHVRAALVEALRSKIQWNEATPQERALYRRLKTVAPGTGR